MTPSDASDSVGCTTTMETESERLRRIRWCACGQPWLPAVGLYGTTEETQCPACILRRLLAEERASRPAGPGIAKAKSDGGAWLPYTEARQAFLWVIDECERYAKEHPEHGEAAQQIAIRVHREARRE